jgi:hypothetical protein
MGGEGLGMDLGLRGYGVMSLRKTWCYVGDNLAAVWAVEIVSMVR